MVAGVTMIEAVIFDLDGVLLQSEEVWDEVREKMTYELGGTWHANASRDMMGMSSPEWSLYMNQELGVGLAPERINEEAVRRMELAYTEHLPLIPGAPEAVERIAARWPLGLASSSNRPLIDKVMDVSGLAGYFHTTVSSEEVERGKPHPDVFIVVAQQMGVDPGSCAAIEDSHTGVQSAHSAGMAVLVLPNQAFPPGEEVLDLADAVLSSLSDLTVELIKTLRSGG
jgi:HAD superfamily hydrolase (TIGR01509 family)